MSAGRMVDDFAPSDSLLDGVPIAGLRLLLAVAVVGLISQELFVHHVKAVGNPCEIRTLRKLFWLRLFFGRVRARCLGRLAETRLPKGLRRPIYRLYARACGAKLEEVREPLESLPSLADFFSRSLKEGSRPIASVPTGFVSPVDGRLVAVGRVDGPGARVEQIKGSTYGLRGLLGQDPYHGRELHCAVLYLSPGDYHRVHSPCSCSIEEGRHFPGEMLPVATGISRWMSDLFCVNERVALSGTWQHGQLHMVLVGAANVGNIFLNFDEEVRTNAHGEAGAHFGGAVRMRRYGNVRLEPGEALGGFRLGSTVVMVFEAPAGFSWSVPMGGKVGLGEPLGFVR